MASFWTKLVDVITPWDRGGERKRREEEAARKAQERIVRPTPQPNIQIQRPQRTIGGQEFSLGVQPDRQVSVPTTPTVQRQDYDNGLINRPKQSLWDKIKDQFDANTEADQYRRQEKLIESVVKRGADRKTVETVMALNPELRRESVRQNNIVPSVANFIRDSVVSVGRGVRAITSNPIESGREELARLTGNKEAERAARYRRDKAMYGKEIADRLAAGGKVTGWETLEGIGNTISVLPAVKGAQLVTQGVRETARTGAFRPLLRRGLEGLDEAFLGVRDLLRRPQNARNLDGLKQAADEVAGINVLTPDQLDDLTRRTNIPVRRPVDIRIPIDEGVEIPVRNLTPQGDIIREVGGDSPRVTSVPTREEIQQARFRNQPFGRPDERIEGVTPRSPEAPYRLDTEVATSIQNKLIDDYADMLRDMGEGNGVDILPDGRRVSNNFRFGDTKGKRMTKAAWREEAERQLRNGEAEPSIQRAFNDASDPEVQSMLARGEQPDVDPGRPISVKQVDSIPVREVTDIPVDDEVGVGSVRPTKVVDRTAEKTEAAARQQAQTAPPKIVGFTEDGTPIYDRQLWFETSPDGTTRVKTSTKASSSTDASRSSSDDMSRIYREIVDSLRENQKAYRSEKKLRKAEFGRRQAAKQRLYDEYRAQGMSAQEAKKAADKALGGAYTKVHSTTPNVSEETVNFLLDKTKTDQNTQNAFSRWLDPNHTESLRDWEIRRIRQFFNKHVGEDAAQAIEEFIVDAELVGDRSIPAKVADFMTSVIASGDISAVGRQGLSGWINHPRMSKQAWNEALKSLRSNGYEEYVTKLKNDPNVAFIEQYGGEHGKFLSLTDKADEARAASDLVDKTPGLNKVVGVSNRHYNTYLDELRLQQKTAIINKYGGQEGFLKAAEAASPGNPEKWIETWFKVIDRQSGRGSLGKAGAITAGDVQVLFSARNLASKFQRLTAPLQLGLLKTNPQAYMYQLRETAAQAAVTIAALAALKESGLVDIENGKIKVGKTRIDITGGFATMIKALNDVRKGFMGQLDRRTGTDAAIDYLRNQFSPLLSTLGRLGDMKFGTGKDKYGNELDAKWWLDAAPLPAVAQTAVDSAFEGEGLFDIARNVFLDAVGLSTNTYMSADDKDQAARAETADVVGAELTRLRDSGLLNDQMISTMSDSLQKVFAEGKTPTEKELGQIKDALVKGVGTGIGADSDTAYRERGDYEKDLAVLQLKKQILEADPTTKPSSLKNLDVQIKRSQVLLENDIPYELFNLYQNTGLEEWRDLAETNPQLYQQLWELDELFTKAGGSYGRGDPTKQKYYAKKSGGGSGGGSRSMTAKFYGGLSNVPERKAYAQTALSKGGTDIPVIRRVRPNIVHRIGRG